MKRSNASKVWDVGNRKQLFMDRRFVAEAEGVSWVVNRPALAGVALEPGPEGSCDDAQMVWLTIIEEDGLYRMWVECRSAKILVNVFEAGNNDSTLPMGYATSSDGIHWEKPEIGLCEWNGSKRNNIVCMDNGTVMIDPACDPSERYKLLVNGHHALGFRTAFADLDPERGGVYLYVSAEGKHWRWNPTRLFPYVPDSYNQLMYDTRIKKYVAYLRVWPDGYLRGQSYGRAIGRVEMDDPLKPWPFVESPNPFLAWGPKLIADPSTEIPMVLCYPNYDQDGHWTDIYNPAIVQYPWAEDAYFAFPSLNHYRPESAFGNHSVLDIGMAVSRDGIRWEWPSLSTPIRTRHQLKAEYLSNEVLAWRPNDAYIPLGELGSGRAGMLFSSLGMIRRGDEIWQYHSATDVEHMPDISKVYGYRKLLNSGRVYRTVQRLDGFVSADFDAAGGAVLSPPLRFGGDHGSACASLSLELNVNAAHGAGTVEICDEAGAPIPGYTQTDALAITEDATSHLVRWKDGADVGKLRNRVVRLRFRMRGCKLYAFQFQRDPAEKKSSSRKGVRQ